MADKAKDLSSGTLVESVSTSATTLKVFVGNGSNTVIEGVWPATPFYITVMPPAPDAGVPNSLDSEIMEVSAVGNDGDGNVVLTVSRAQRGTTAQAFTEGAIITNAVYAEDAVLNSGVKSGVNNAQTELRDKDGNPIYPKVSDVESSELESIFERELRMLVPTGTAISSSKDLNTVEFLKVGRYYCSTNVTAATLTNCPTSSAFMMEVFSPLSTSIDNETTGTWVYRTRLLTTFNGQMFVQSCNSNGTVNNWSYGSWRRYDVPGVKSATAVTHTDYNNNQNYIPDMSFLSFWNGAYNSSGNSNISKLANGCIKSAHLSEFSTANTADTWVPVASSGNLQHRVIKPFNADGTIPITALDTYSSGACWSKVPIVNSSGTTEVGKYIDFHNTNGSTNNYDVRLTINSTGGTTVTIPNKTGTMALTSDFNASTDVLSTAITAASGYTITGSMRKFGCMVFMNIAVKKNSGNFGTGQESVATIASAYRPVSDINTYCSLSSNEWDSNRGLGYAYVSATVYVKDANASSSNWAKISVAYTTA